MRVIPCSWLHLHTQLLLDLLANLSLFQLLCQSFFFPAFALSVFLRGFSQGLFFFQLLTILFLSLEWLASNFFELAQLLLLVEFELQLQFELFLTVEAFFFLLQLTLQFLPLQQFLFLLHLQLLLHLPLQLRLHLLQHLLLLLALQLPCTLLFLSLFLNFAQNLLLELLDDLVVVASPCGREGRCSHLLLLNYLQLAPQGWLDVPQTLYHSILAFPLACRTASIDPDRRLHLFPFLISFQPGTHHSFKLCLLWLFFGFEFKPSPAFAVFNVGLRQFAFTAVVPLLCLATVGLVDALDWLYSLLILLQSLLTHL
jgi:hypothetical protein